MECCSRACLISAGVTPQVPVYVTQVVPEVEAEVVLKTLYTTRELPVVVTEPKIMYVTKTAYLNLATTEVKYLPAASIDYQPIPVSHTAHVPVTITETKIETKTIKNTSYVTRFTTSYATSVVTTTRFKTQLSVSTTIIHTTQLLTNSVLNTKTLCLDESFRRGVNNLLVEGVGGLIGTYDSDAAGSGGVYAGKSIQLQGSYGNKIY